MILGSGRRVGGSLGSGREVHWREKREAASRKGGSLPLGLPHSILAWTARGGKRGKEEAGGGVTLRRGGGLGEQVLRRSLVREDLRQQ